MAVASSSGSVDSSLKDYPIVLGNTLKHSTSSSSKQLTALRYNWQPKSSFAGSTSTLKVADGQYSLSISDQSGKTNTYIYQGKPNSSSSEDQKGHSTSLVLVFDPVKSVYALEAVHSPIDLNIKTAAGYSEKELKAHPRISTSKPPLQGANVLSNPATDDEAPDSDNPFDYRHFLSEARENATKSSQNTGSLTPIPGSLTPMNGMHSPVPAASRFLASTPQFRPNSGPTKKHHADSQNQRRQTAEAKARGTPRPVALASQPLSKALVSDSDDEMSDVVPLPQSLKAPKNARTKGHARNASSGGFGKSPHIVVNDGDLEIDMGSPPPQDKSHRKVLVDPDAFRSHTNTPQPGVSSNKKHEVPNQTRHDEDVEMGDFRNDVSEEDNDVEALALGSPRTSRSEKQDEAAVAPIVAGNRAPNDVDEDEDLLAAELEAAFEEEESTTADRNEGGFGLGIITGAKQDDDESEISEEE